MTVDEVTDIAKELGYDIDLDSAKTIAELAGDDKDYAIYLIEGTCE